MLFSPYDPDSFLLFVVSRCSADDCLSIYTVISYALLVFMLSADDMLGLVFLIVL